MIPPYRLFKRHEFIFNRIIDGLYGLLPSAALLPEHGAECHDRLRGAPAVVSIGKPTNARMAFHRQASFATEEVAVDIRSGLDISDGVDKLTLHACAEASESATS